MKPAGSDVKPVECPLVGTPLPMTGQKLSLNAHVGVYFGRQPANLLGFVVAQGLVKWVPDWFAQFQS
jgi:hypothetical protein